MVALVAWLGVEGAGPRTLRRLRDRFGGLARAWGATPTMLVERGGLSPERAAALAAARPGLDPFRLWQIHVNSGLDLVLETDDRFPELLRHIPVPPLALWKAGELSTSSRAIAVVGTRRPTPYGRRMAARISGELAAETSWWFRDSRWGSMPRPTLQHWQAGRPGPSSARPSIGSIRCLTVISLGRSSVPVGACSANILREPVLLRGDFRPGTVSWPASVAGPS